MAVNVLQDLLITRPREAGSLCLQIPLVALRIALLKQTPAQPDQKFFPGISRSTASPCQSKLREKREDRYAQPRPPKTNPMPADRLLRPFTAEPHLESSPSLNIQTFSAWPVGSSQLLGERQGTLRWALRNMPTTHRPTKLDVGNVRTSKTGSWKSLVTRDSQKLFRKAFMQWSQRAKYLDDVPELGSRLVEHISGIRAASLAPLSRGVGDLWRASSFVLEYWMMETLLQECRSITALEFEALEAPLKMGCSQRVSHGHGSPEGAVRSFLLCTSCV